MARKFSSYGPIDIDEHYYAPREALIEQAPGQLVGDNPHKGGLRRKPIGIQRKLGAEISYLIITC